MGAQTTGFSGKRILFLLGIGLLIGATWYGGQFITSETGFRMGMLGGMMHGTTGQMMGEAKAEGTSNRCPMHAMMHGDAPRQTSGGLDDGVADDLNLETATKQWLGRTRGLETIEDRTGESEIVIKVGAGNGLTYAPAAVRVDPGTTIRWEWTGSGGLHDVAFVNAEVDASLRGDQGAEYTHTFAESGEYRYECTPHTSVGMRGMVIVAKNG